MVQDKGPQEELTEITNHWIYNGQPFIHPIAEFEGFVYLLTNTVNGRRYIGKKHFWTRRKSKKTKRRVTKESDWRNYCSSSDNVKADIEIFGIEAFDKEILHLCKYKKQMTFLEQKEQWNRDVLLTDDYYNTNIGGKFFVRERKIYYIPVKEITMKNDKWREIKAEQMIGDSNPAKRLEVRKKISEKKRGSKHHQFGRKLSVSHLAALHSASRKAVKKSVTDGDITWETMKDCRKSLDISIYRFYRLVKKGKLWYTRQTEQTKVANVP